MDNAASFFVAISWLFVVSATFFQVGKYKVETIGFIAGILFGMAVFLCIPMIFILYFGYYTNSVLNFPTFYVYSDISTDVQLLIGAVIILLYAKFTHKPLFFNRIKEGLLFKKTFQTFLGAYVILSLIVFLYEGKLAGGHWASNVGTAISSNPILILPIRIISTLRTGLFGFIVLLFLRKEFSFLASIGYGLFLTIFDVFTSFNRITIMYFGMLIFLMMKGRQKIWFFFSVLMLAPVVGYASSIWSTFRGTALEGGYNIDSFNRALGESLNQSSGVDGIFDTLNSLTEASNIQVFNFIVQHFGYDLNYLWGQTFVLRGLRGFLPIQLFFTRSVTFGNMLGFHLFNANVALNSTLFGELYGNFSQLWPIPFILTIMIIGRLELALSKKFPGINYFFFFLGFAWWRFDMEFVTTSMIFIVALMFLFNILRINRRKSSPEPKIELQSL